MTPVKTRIRELWDTLCEKRSVSLFEDFSRYVRALRPGDRLLMYVLAGLLALVSIGSGLKLEQSLLVRVPAYGGTLTEGALGSPRFVNPLLAITEADHDLSALTYAGLMGLAGDGTLQPVLAESYSVSDDGKEYTFTIRPDAVFSNGMPVTAHDVVFTVKKAQDPALKSSLYASWVGITSEAIDARTVRFTLQKPYAPFIQNTRLGILPERLWGNLSSEEFPFSNLETTPIGAGPFTVQNVSRDASGLITSYTLARNDTYVGGRPYLSKIRFLFFAQAEDLAIAMKNGKIQSAYGINGETTLAAPYSHVFGVFFNPNQNKVFTHLEVRKALSLAIDRDTLIQEALGGHGHSILGPVPPGSGITETAVPKGGDATLDAAKILEQAGWAYDGTTRVWKNGNMSLDQITIRTSNVPELKAVGSAVKAAWEKLGVPTTIELYERGDLDQNVIRPRKYDALLFGMNIGKDQDLYAFWDSQKRNYPGLNIAMYANKSVDDLLQAIRQTSDPKRHLSDLQKVNDAISADYPAAFIYAPDFVYGVPKDLGGVVLPQIAAPEDRFASVSKWYRATNSVWPFFAGSQEIRASSH